MKAKSAYKTKPKPKKKLKAKIKKPTKSKKLGRPSKKDSLDFEIGCNLAKYGHTLAEIADIIGVAESNLYEWLRKDKLFQESIKEGKKVADSRVEDSLYKLSNGYSYDEIKKENMVIDGKAIKKAFRITTTTKQIAPNVTAQIFWLKNRKPDEWREKKDGEGGDTYITNIIDSFKGNGRLTEDERLAVSSEVRSIEEALNTRRSISAN